MSTENKKLEVNIEANSASLSINAEIYLKILNKAIDQTTEDLKTLEAALANTDIEQTQAISHRLKGDFDNLRITDLASVAKELNDLAKAGTEFDKMKDLFDQFVGYFVQLREIIQNQGK